MMNKLTVLGKKLRGKLDHGIEYLQTINAQMIPLPVVPKRNQKTIKRGRYHE